MINPLWLRSFCTLVDIGHFTRTAELLNMTQSGVSQHVHKLEELLAQPLLVRQGKSFTLTPSGERLYEEGRELIVSLEELEQRVALDPAHEGVVKIASPGSVGLKLYPMLLALQQRYPQLIIEYRFAPNSEIERLIAERKVDIGLMTCLSAQKNMQLRAIAHEELLLIVPANTQITSWDQLLELGFIDHPDGAYHAGQLLSVNFEQYQAISQFKRSGFCNQINLILEPVSMGLGFTVLPRHAVSAFKDSDKVKIQHLKHKVSETLYLANHANSHLANRVHTVLTSIEQCLL
jgi:DNA-binding transcriptional LysR family regulator